MVYWTVLLTSCAVLTIVGTLFWKRPLLAAVGASVLVSLGIGLPTMQTGAFWILVIAIVLIFSLPVTIVTGIVTKKLMDKRARAAKTS